MCWQSSSPVSFKFLFVRNYFLSTLTKIGSPRFRRWIVDHLPGKNVKRMTKIIDTLHDTSLMIYESKKKAIMEGDQALLSQIGRGKDIMSILSAYQIYSLTWSLYSDFLLQSEPTWMQKRATAWQRKKLLGKCRMCGVRIPGFFMF